MQTLTSQFVARFLLSIPKYNCWDNFRSRGLFYGKMVRVLFQRPDIKPPLKKHSNHPLSRMFWFYIAYPLPWSVARTILETWRFTEYWLCWGSKLSTKLFYSFLTTSDIYLNYNWFFEKFWLGIAKIIKKLRQIMNTFSASGLLLQYRKLNRARLKPSPLTLAYGVILSAGTAMLYLTVMLSNQI